MDLSPMVNQLIKALLYLIPLMVIIGVVKSPWFKGVLGEFIVNTMAKLFLNKKDYRLIKNVTLPTEDGTTQIDHIIVSKFGVFVVETKNMKGWIFGGMDQKTWTQKLYRHTSKFQNPLHQNYKHVQTLKSALGLNDQQVHSLVVFVGNSTFKTEMPANVTYGGGYLRFIKSKTQPVISDDEVDVILGAIEAGRLERSLKTHREHVEHVRNIVNEKRNPTDCPKCGSPMAIREIKKGQNQGNRFLGCSRFPQCRGTAAIPGEAVGAI